MSSLLLSDKQHTLVCSIFLESLTRSQKRRKTLSAGDLTNTKRYIRIPSFTCNCEQMRYLSIVQWRSCQSSSFNFLVRWGRSSISNSSNEDIVVKSFSSSFDRAAFPGRTLTAIVYPALNAALASVKTKHKQNRKLTTTSYNNNNNNDNDIDNNNKNNNKSQAVKLL